RGETCQVFERRFATPGCAAGAEFIIDVESRADDRGVADASGNLEGQTAGRRHTRNVAVATDSAAMNRSRWPREALVVGATCGGCGQRIGFDVRWEDRQIEESGDVRVDWP